MYVSLIKFTTQLPDIGFCFEGNTYGSRFGCYDGEADGKDCAESYTADVFVYGCVSSIIDRALDSLSEGSRATGRHTVHRTTVASAGGGGGEQKWPHKDPSCRRCFYFEVLNRIGSTESLLFPCMAYGNIIFGRR